MTGIKHDVGKLRYDLVPPEWEESLAMVMTYGEEKYGGSASGAAGWKEVDNGFNRYYSALRRHLSSAIKGEEVDPESGLNHLEHAMVNIGMMMYHQQKPRRELLMNIKDHLLAGEDPLDPEVCLDMPEPVKAAQKRKERHAADDARFMGRSERELGDSAKMDGGPIGARLTKQDDDLPADSAHGATDGDEFTSAWPNVLERKSVHRHRDYFAARLIDDLPDPEPRVLGAGLWAEVIGAIADRLDAGRAIPPHPELIAMLRSMERGILGIAA